MKNPLSNGNFLPQTQDRLFDLQQMARRPGRGNPAQLREIKPPQA
jgi:hypothetical protein